MPIRLLSKEVGPWPMNSYLVACQDSGASAIIDPGADAEAILDLAKGTHVDAILITHGHFDHVDALPRVKALTGAPVYINATEAANFNLEFDIALADGDVIKIGESSLRAMHTPGHTAGMTCFDLGDGRIIVGDTVFVGGPGKTWSAEDFTITMRTMQQIVFAWSDETKFYPGHGPAGRIGDERGAFEAFVRKGWPDDLFGDVTWR